MGAGFVHALAALDTWFGDCDVPDTLRLEAGEIAGRLHVAYRYRGERPAGPFLIEQQAYYDEIDGRIGWMRILCSDLRPR